MPSSRYAPHRFSIRQKVLLGFGMLLTMFLISSLVSWRSSRSFVQTASRVALARDALEFHERLRRSLVETETARLAFLLTGDERHLARFENARESVLQNLTATKTGEPAAAAQDPRFAHLNGFIQRDLAWQASQVEAWRAHGVEAAMQVAQPPDDPNEQIAQLLNALETEQRQALASGTQQGRAIARATTLAIVAAIALTLGALVFASWMILGDIGARRRVEEALAAEHNLLSSIMNTMPNHVFVKDAKGRFILDNAAHRRYLGLEVEQSIEGHTVFDYYAAADAERFDRDDRCVIETGHPILNREEPVQRPSVSRESWLETTKVPLRDNDGRIVGLVGISSDISERKTSEEQLRRFAAQLERSNTELQNFASVASHDLQEPLRKIQAFGDRLRAKYAELLGEQGRGYLERMHNAAQRMQVLIQDLLKLSRVTSRAQPFERCDLDQVLGEVLSDLEVAIESEQAKIVAGSLPTIDADPLQMRQLFQNLISNALKFRKPGEAPLVQVSGRVVGSEQEAGGTACEISVRDYGIGFDKEFAEQVFVVFQRLHTRAEYEGTGIGLALCRKITDRHGGRIVAESAAGEGATFTVTLPVIQTPAEIHETK